MCIKYIIDVTIYTNSVQSWKCVSFGVFLCAFQLLVCVLLNSI